MMGLKRKGDQDDLPQDDAKRRQVEELMKLEKESGAAGTSSGTSGKLAETKAGKRQMQGQSAESGMHSIDSDEEEEYERMKKDEELSDEELEGIEDAGNVEREGEVQITPFNMKEEREEGYITKDGSFVFNKKKEEIKDNWLDNIDWGKVKERSEEEKKKQDDDDEKEDEAAAKYNELETYKAILAMMKPKETVAKTLIRLGGGKKTTAQKLKEKKRQKEGKETEEEKKNRENMEKLTGLADAILSRSGHMEIYEETYESIAYKIKQEEEKPAPQTVIPEGTNEDDALDMFMESAKDREEKDVSTQDKSKEAKAEEANPVSFSDEVKWEFRWEDKDDAEIHGPHTSEEMLKWQESGYFSKGVFVRKYGATEFRDGKRIDFDLYI